VKSASSKAQAAFGMFGMSSYSTSGFLSSALQDEQRSFGSATAAATAAADNLFKESEAPP
jgi:hypothetical protein